MYDVDAIFFVQFTTSCLICQATESYHLKKTAENAAYQIGNTGIGSYLK